MLIAAASFAGVLAILLGAYWLFILRPEGRAERALRRRLNPAGTLRTPKREPLLKRVVPLSTVPMLEKVLSHSSRVVLPLGHLIQRSGLRVTVGLFVLATLALALIGFAVTQLIAGVWIALGISCALAAVPFLVVRRAAARRIAKFEEQFPEAIALIARALRAGHALTTALGMVSDEMAEPVRSEFTLLHDRQNYGMPMADALRNFGERIPSLDARFFVTAVLTQRDAGGNLSEVLDNLATVIRERFKLKRQVRVLSAHGRITGWILGALPFVIGGGLFVIAPDHVSKLFTDPLGLQIVAGALFLQAVGVVAIRKIVNIEV
jgi:tight adherence protein B